MIAATSGLGEIVGGIAISQLRIRRIGIAMYAAAAFGGIWLGMYGLIPLFPLLLLYGIGVGMGFVGFGVLWDTAVQRFVPRELLGRVGSVDWFGSILLGPLAPLVAGVLVTQVGPAAVLAGGGFIVALLCGGALLVPSIRGLRAEDHISEPLPLIGDST